MPQRKSDDPTLAREQVRSGASLMQRRKLKKAIGKTNLGSRTQDRLFMLAADGKINFGGLIDVLKGRKSLVDLGVDKK